MSDDYAQVLFTYESEQEWRPRAVQVSVDANGSPDHILPDLKATRDLQTATHTHHGPGGAAANFVFVAKYRQLLSHLHPKMAYRDEVPTHYFDPEDYWPSLRYPRWLMDYRISAVGSSRYRDDWFLEVRIPDPEYTPLPENRAEWTISIEPLDGDLFDPVTRDAWEYEGSLEEAITIYS